MQRNFALYCQSKRTAAFTIVELLVVVSILALLLAIVLPVVNGARESARRMACNATQAQLAMAITRFHTAKDFLPGSLNNLSLEPPSSPGVRQTSWFAMLLPYMGHNDIFQQLQQGVAPSNAPLSEGICASGLSTSMNIGNWLTYGINAGTAASPGTYRFHDGAVISNSGNERKSFDDIRNRDGLSNTWLTADSMGFTAGGHNEWHQWSNTNATLAGILGFRNWQVTSPPLNAWGTGSGNPPSPNGIPPRSRHPDGVVFAFCDGRTKFVNENLAVHVYGHLTTSYSFWTTSNSYSAGPGAVNSGWANYWLRAAGCPPATQEPLQINEGDHY